MKTTWSPSLDAARFQKWKSESRMEFKDKNMQKQDKNHMTKSESKPTNPKTTKFHKKRLHHLCLQTPDWIRTQHGHTTQFKKCKDQKDLIVSLDAAGFQKCKGIVPNLQGSALKSQNAKPAIFSIVKQYQRPIIVRFPPLNIKFPNRLIKTNDGKPRINRHAIFWPHTL